MNTNLRSAIIFSVITALTACGGDDKDSSAKQLTIEQLQKNLPEINTALDSSTPAGLWVGDFSNSAEFESDRANGSRIDNGRMIFLIKPTSSESGYRVHLCAYNATAMDSDIFTLNEDSLKLTVDESYPEENEVWQWNLDFALDQNLAGTLTGDYIDEYEGYSRTEAFLMAATKISDATSFTNAASEFDISFRASSEEEFNFSEVSGTMSCVVSSEMSVKGTATTGEKYNGSFVVAEANFDNYDYAAILEYRISGITDLEAGEVTFYMGTESRENYCQDDEDQCVKATEASVNITEWNPEAFTFAASASLDDGQPDIELSFSISAP